MHHFQITRSATWMFFLFHDCFSDDRIPINDFSPLLHQFVCVESLVTAIVDMYPAVFRRKYRRELFLLGVVLVSFLMGLVMLMEVGVTLWDYKHTDSHSQRSTSTEVKLACSV